MREAALGGQQLAFGGEQVDLELGGRRRRARAAKPQDVARLCRAQELQAFSYLIFSLPSDNCREEDGESQDNHD